MSRLYKKSFVAVVVILLMGIAVVPTLNAGFTRIIRKPDIQLNIKERENCLNLSFENCVIYVDDDAPPEWYDPWHVRTIQEGIDNASIYNCDKIYVYSGRYDNEGFYILVNSLRDMTIIGEDKNSTIVDCNGNEGGFLFESCKNVTLSSFTVQKIGLEGDDIGIVMEGCYNCMILNCIVKDSGSWGISLEASHYNIIENCDVHNCELDGIIITKNSSNNKILYCTISKTRNVGIVNGACNNVVMGNTFLSNRRAGIIIAEANPSAGRSTGNFVYCNDFFDNRVFGFKLNAVDLCGGNHWYNGTVGNYWDNYLGLKFPKLFDPDGDGVGNIPYRILIFGLDRYPLMEPCNLARDPPFIKQGSFVIQDQMVIGQMVKNAFRLNNNNPMTINSGRTLIVPIDYPTIQQAIDNASDGDIIRVYAGVYRENVMVNKKLNIIGNGSANTTIDGIGGIVVTIASGYTNFSGFKITNGTSGIYVISSFNTIEKNNISSNVNGIFSSSSFNNYFMENTLCLNTQRGVWLASSNNNTIENNIIKSNDWDCILMQNSNGNIISNNSLVQNQYSGVDMIKCSNNYIIGNSISNNREQGILMADGSCRNTIAKNIISYNGGELDDFGIYIVRESNDNLIYGNSFIRNGLPLARQNAWDDCINNWDNGSIGNRWDDHWFAKDEDLNDISDIPYGIRPWESVLPYPVGINNDRYPIMYNPSDKNPPHVEFHKPLEGFWYLCGSNTGYPTPITVIVGHIDISVKALDDEGPMQGVNFYIDKIKEIPDFSVSDGAIQIYNWNFDETLFGFHTFIALAVDEAGNKNVTAMPVLIFNIKWTPCV